MNKKKINQNTNTQILNTRNSFEEKDYEDCRISDEYILVEEVDEAKAAIDNQVAPIVVDNPVVRRC